MSNATQSSLTQMEGQSKKESSMTHTRVKRYVGYAARHRRDCIDLHDSISPQQSMPFPCRTKDNKKHHKRRDNRKVFYWLKKVKLSKQSWSFYPTETNCTLSPKKTKRKIARPKNKNDPGCVPRMFIGVLCSWTRWFHTAPTDLSKWRHLFVRSHCTNGHPRLRLLLLMPFAGCCRCFPSVCLQEWSPDLKEEGNAFSRARTLELLWAFPKKKIMPIVHGRPCWTFSMKNSTSFQTNLFVHSVGRVPRSLGTNKNADFLFERFWFHKTSDWAWSIVATPCFRN